MELNDIEAHTFTKTKVKPLLQTKVEVLIAICTLLFWVSFAVRYQNACELIRAEKAFLRASDPPVECGPHARKFSELDWRTWILLTLDNQSRAQCQLYLEQLHRSEWASPFEVLIQLLAHVCGEPVRIWMHLFGNGMRGILQSHSYLIQVLLIVAAVGAVVLTVKVCLWHRFMSTLMPKPTLPFYQPLPHLQDTTCALIDY